MPYVLDHHHYHILYYIWICVLYVHDWCHIHHREAVLVIVQRMRAKETRVSKTRPGEESEFCAEVLRFFFFLATET